MLLIRPLVPFLTRSELHAIMTAGFATVSTGTLAGYIMFGVRRPSLFVIFNSDSMALGIHATILLAKSRNTHTAN